QAEDGIRDFHVTGVQTCALPISATGRLSSINPNLQNIPIRTARGREIRKAFVPRDEDHVLLSADYSQIELRLMAAFSGDESMLEIGRASCRERVEISAVAWQVKQ